jgi:hypothetical protein
MRVAGSQGAAGTVELTISMRNAAAATCTLHGYPGAQLLNATGTELMTQVVRGGTFSFTDFAATTVTLASGSTAYFNLGYSDVPTGTETTCPTAAHLEVTPPNAVDHGTVPIQAQVCNGGTLTVSPVFASGSANTQTTAPAQG